MNPTREAGLLGELARDEIACLDAGEIRRADGPDIASGRGQLSSSEIFGVRGTAGHKPHSGLEEYKFAHKHKTNGTVLWRKRVRPLLRNKK